MSGPSLSQSSSSTSSSLLQRAREHDPQAWERISKLYGPAVYQWCRRAGLQSSDSADVVQDVFRSVAASLNRFRHDRPADTFRGWLWTITRNKIHDHFRALAARPDVQGGSSQRRFQELPEIPPDQSADGSGGGLTSDLARRAVELMKTDFEPSTWQSFWKTAVEQRAAADVAQELGISTAAVYMAKSRVLRRLREELAGLDVFD